MAMGGETGETGPSSHSSVPKALAKAWPIGALERRTFGPAGVSPPVLPPVFYVENGVQVCLAHFKGSAYGDPWAQGLTGPPPTVGVWGRLEGNQSLKPWHVRF